MSKDQLKSYLNNQTPHDLNKFKILSKDETLQPFLIRIDKNPPKAFVPLMPEKALGGEDRTVPRISTSTTVMDCLRGFGVFHSDITGDKSYNKKDPFRNGYVISKIDFDCCVVPSKELLPDVEGTKEHWVVGYNEDHVSIKQDTIGKVIFVEMVTKGRSDTKDFNPVEIIWHIEVTNDDGIYLTDKILLSKGYYRFITTQKFKDSEVVHGVITKQEYDSVKKLSAALLSMQNKPSCLEW